MYRYGTLLLIGLVAVFGCGYGEVSPTAYELAKSLYNISNRKLNDKLDDVEELIETAEEEKQISDKEARWLKAVLRDAEKAKWEKAMKSARQIMEDQITR